MAKIQIVIDDKKIEDFAVGDIVYFIDDGVLKSDIVTRVAAYQTGNEFKLQLTTRTLNSGLTGINGEYRFSKDVETLLEILRDDLRI